MANTIETVPNQVTPVRVIVKIDRSIIDPRQWLKKLKPSHEKPPLVVGAQISTATSIWYYIAIRKLTPRECFRLMGFSDADFLAAMTGSRKCAEGLLSSWEYTNGKRIMDRAEKIQGMSNSQLYKQAGNSIVVDILYYIYLEIHKAMPYLLQDVKLASFFSGIGAFETAFDRFYKEANKE